MAESTASSAKGRKPRKDAAEPAAEPAKARFSRALDEARAGAQQLGKEAQERADLYRDKLQTASSEWASEARVRGDEARERATDMANEAKVRATDMANEAKTRASEGISTIGRLVEDNAHLVDEKVGSKYGDYARSAARSMQDAATRLDNKDLGELGQDAKEFVRKSPGLAIGVAAVAGFMLARLFRGSND